MFVYLRFGLSEWLDCYVCCSVVLVNSVGRAL